MIQAVIFDMDGLLIDSEPLWEISEIEVFSKVGVPLTREMTKQTMGQRSDEVVKYWHSRYPLYGADLKQFWVPVSERNERGWILRDYRHEVDRRELLNAA